MHKTKSKLLAVLLLWLVSAPTFAISRTNNPMPPDGPPSFWDIFGPSDFFTKGSSYLWGNYQFASNRGSRPETTAGILPPVGLYYEHYLFWNLGLRLGINGQAWNEDRVLFESATTQYKEEFEYRYATASAGLAFHFTVSDVWDPYIGVDWSYRYARGFCDCVDETNTRTTRDLFIGTRFFISNSFFLMAEFGSHGVGYGAVGLGYNFY